MEERGDLKDLLPSNSDFKAITSVCASKENSSCLLK